MEFKLRFNEASVGATGHCRTVLLRRASQRAMPPNSTLATEQLTYENETKQIYTRGVTSFFDFCESDARTHTHTFKRITTVQPPDIVGLTSQSVLTVKQSLKGMLSMFMTVASTSTSPALYIGDWYTKKRPKCGPPLTKKYLLEAGKHWLFVCAKSNK
eukprot:1146883-Pelagomonas_calceolata.AAC.3